MIKTSDKPLGPTPPGLRCRLRFEHPSNSHFSFGRAGNLYHDFNNDAVV